MILFSALPAELQTVLGVSLSCLTGLEPATSPLEGDSWLLKITFKRARLRVGVYPTSYYDGIYPTIRAKGYRKQLKLFFRTTLKP